MQCQLTTPHTRQQNGVVERRNRTVLEMTRSLLKAMTVPDQFWGEAVCHSMYLLNRTGTKALKDVTPYEVWKGSKPSVAHLKVFGCVGFVKKLRGLTKLSDHCETMIYLRAKDGTKGYRLYNPRNRRIVIARDVVFEESKVLAWNEQLTNEPLTTPYWTNVLVQEATHLQPAQEQPTPDNVNATPTRNYTRSPDFRSSDIQIDDTPISASPGDGSRATSSNQLSGIYEDDGSATSFDDTSVKGFRSINEIYQNAERMDEDEVQRLYERYQELLLIDDEPTTFEEA